MKLIFLCYKNSEICSIHDCFKCFVFEVESTDLNNNNYGFLHNIHDLFLKGFLFSYFFFPLGPPPYPEGNSNSTSNFPSFSQSVFFLFFPFKPLPYPEGNFNFALYFPFFSLRFFFLPFLHLNIFSTFREIPI